MKITDKHMGATKPISTEQWFVESGNRGEGAFVGRVSPKGARLFYFRYTGPNRVQVRLPVGTYEKDGKDGGMTVATARAIALEWAVLYKSGVLDLRQHFADEAAGKVLAADAARIQAAAAAQAADLEQSRRLTARQLFERWASTALTPQIRTDGTRSGRKDGGKYTREQFERRIFPKLGNVAAIDVRKADVLAILDAVKATGKLRTANILLTELKQMLRFAVTREIIPHSPLEAVSKSDVGGKETERDRVLTPDEIAALARALPLSSLQSRSALALWLVLSTGCRIGELMSAEWKHVDTLARTLYLPDTKNQRDHIVHLSDFALSHIESLAGLREAGADGQPMPWLFPNTAGKGPVCIKSLGKQLADRQRDPSRRMMNRAQDTDSLTLAGGRWTAHDLRRTAATLMAGLGVSTDVIDECLNHKLQSKVARVYIKDRRLGEQARAFDALGSKLTAFVSGEPVASNVVSFRAA